MTEDAAAVAARALASGEAGDLSACPIRQVLDRIGDKWSILLLLTLAGGSARFNALGRVLPDISRRMLSETLKSLEADGLVWREVTPSTPPAVAYGLTGRGRALIVALRPLVDWAAAEAPAILAERARAA
jgi:DNA-binding HxlR family transcriptional regulator